MKTGVDGAEPLGFYRALARVYDADLHSTDLVRIERSEGSLDFSKDMTMLVREETERRTAASLAAGRSVFYDGFLNTFDRREDMRELAAENGGFAVSLTMVAPLAVAKRRLTERFGNGLLTIPSELSPLEDRLEVMGIMARQLHRGGWAHRNSDLDDKEETVVLNGEHTIARLLGDVAVHLEDLQSRELLV